MKYILVSIDSALSRSQHKVGYGRSFVIKGAWSDLRVMGMISNLL